PWRRPAALVVAAALVAALAAVLGAGPPENRLAPRLAAATSASLVPPVRHVWVINLENQSYQDEFGTPGNAPYLASTLRSMGVHLSQYFGIGHNSLDNYVAEVSGQAPDPDTQTDCGSWKEFTPTDGPVDGNGQAVGQGCVYPSKVKTIGDQMDPSHADLDGHAWKIYNEDLGEDRFWDYRNDDGRCPHPNIKEGFGGDAGVSSDRYVGK